MNEAGRNTEISTSVMPTIGANSTSMARIAASWPFMPCSILWAAPSTTTMASSTTMPIASTIANSVERLMVKPSAAIAANAPMMVTGTVVAGTSMARQSCRNSRMTASTRRPASISVMYTSRTDAETNVVVSNGVSYLIPAGNARASSAIFFSTAFSTSSALAPGDWNTPMPVAGCLLSEKIWL
jgi:hypothetical protein